MVLISITHTHVEVTTMTSARLYFKSYSRIIRTGPVFPITRPNTVFNCFVGKVSRNCAAVWQTSHFFCQKLCIHLPRHKKAVLAARESNARIDGCKIELVKDCLSLRLPLRRGGIQARNFGPTIFSNTVSSPLQFLKARISDFCAFFTYSSLSSMEEEEEAAAIIEFQVLSIHHDTSRDSCVDLYGKTIDGETVCIHVVGVPDYFRVGKSAVSKRFPTVNSVREALVAEGIGVSSISEIAMQPLYYYNGGKTIPLYDVKLSHPRQRKQAQAVFGSGSGVLYDSWQRSYVEKFCTDYRIQPCGWLGVRKLNYSAGKRSTCHIEGTIIAPPHFYFPPTRDILVDHTILGFDLECANLRVHTQMVHRAFDPIIQISVAIGCLSNATLTVRDKIVFCWKETAPVDGDVEILSFDGEGAMLRAFLEFVKCKSPDVITGYNINGFDLPYLWARCEMMFLDVNSTFSKNVNVGASLRSYEVTNNQIGKRQSYRIIAPGMLICDCMVLVRDFIQVKLDSYSLNAVARSLLGGREKEDMPYAEIPKIFKDGDPVELARIASYCMTDTMLVMEILSVTDGIQSLSQTANTVGLDRADIIHHAQQRMCLSTICNQIRDAGNQYTIPAEVKVYASSTKYKGAVVLPPATGMYSDPVVVLDFASMYPSIIRAKNICYTTLTTEREIADEAWIEGVDYHRTPGVDGGLYVTPLHRKSLFGSIIERLSVLRKEAKKGMVTPGSVGYAMADARQQAFKRTANSLYGLCGAKRGALLPCVLNAASVTAYGRQLLHDTKLIIERRVDISARVIYGDTDSVFVRINIGGGDDKDVVAAVGTQLAREATLALNTPPMILEYEKVVMRLFLLGKKNYMGDMYTPDGKRSLLVKGIGAIKRDKPKFIRDLMQRCITLVLRENDWKSARNLIRVTVEKMAMDGGRSRDPWEFAKTISITKHRDDYKLKEPPAHFLVAERMWKTDDPDAPSIGDRMPMVICKARNDEEARKVCLRGQHPKDVCGDLYVDTDYYIEQLQKTVLACFRYLYKTPAFLMRDVFPPKIVNPKGRFVAARPRQNLITKYYYYSR